MRRALDPTRGSTLVEALAALALIGIAAALVALAAGVSARALRQSEVTRRLTAIAARELARAQSLDLPTPATLSLDGEPGFPDGVRTVVRVEHAADLVGVRVRAAGGRPPGAVTLATRMVRAD